MCSGLWRSQWGLLVIDLKKYLANNNITILLRALDSAAQVWAVERIINGYLRTDTSTIITEPVSFAVGVS